MFFFVATVKALWRPVITVLRLLLGHGSLAVEAPGRKPFLGHLFTLKGRWNDIWDFFAASHALLGPTLRFIIGPDFYPARVFIISKNPSVVEHILKNKFDIYGKGPEVSDMFDEFLGEGIFVVDGHRWQEQRKKAAGIFSRRNFSENMVAVFQAHARQVVRVLMSRSQKSPNIEVEMQELLFSLTLDSFCEIAFGLPWNSIESSGTEDSDCPSKLFATHFDRAQAVIVTRFAYRPFWKLERFALRFGLLPPEHDEAKLSASLNFINRHVDTIIERHLSNSNHAEPRQHGFGKPNLLSLFLEISKDKKYLRDVVMNFLLAGRDTTACTLSWLLWELAKSPSDFGKLREEVFAQAKRHSPPQLKYENLHQMKFCNACVRETIRLHPAVPADPKVALSSDVLPDGTLVFEGDYVFYEPYVMGREVEHWGLDAAEWKPERWLHMDKEPSIFVNCAFQAGPRICLGRDMAILEIKAVLAEFVLSGMEWTVRPGYSPSYRYPSLVLPMADPGLPCTVSFQSF